MNLRDALFTGVLVKLLLAVVLFALSIYGFRVCSGTTGSLTCTTGLIIPVQMPLDGEPVTYFLTNFQLIAAINIIFWYFVSAIVVSRIRGE